MTHKPRPKGIEREDLTAPDVLQRVFSADRLNALIRRVSSRHEKDDVISHPLKSLVLVEFGAQLAEQLSRAVPQGYWAPSPSYLCFSHKRSGGFRELVYTTLVDGIVGRCAVDALEPYLTGDDDGKTFAGRSHSSSQREYGDYGDWFQVWRDYSSALDQAARQAGYAYVFDTDVNDFFPSIEREKAKALLASRTGADQSLLDLLFDCLVRWLPRFGYTAMSGIPVENNDVSRLVAHNYLKSVDAAFRGRSDCVYLRYVDDTVVFAPDEVTAEQCRRVHHTELRRLGLSPSSAKTSVLPVEEYQLTRHRDINLLLENAKKYRSAGMFEAAAGQWMSMDQHARGWDHAGASVYSVGRQLKQPLLRDRALDDIGQSSRIATAALRYLGLFELSEVEVLILQDASVHARDLIVSIGIAQLLSNARVEGDQSNSLAESAVSSIVLPEERPGGGYLRSQWLLVLHKHGNAGHRERILNWARNQDILDEQWRLHFLYVFGCCEEIAASEVAAASLLANADIQLMLRLCAAARTGTLANHGALLRRCIQQLYGVRGIPAQFLPFLRLVTSGKGSKRAETIEWLESTLKASGRQAVADKAVIRFLEKRLESLLD